MRVGDYGRTFTFEMKDQRGRDEPIDDATAVDIVVTKPDGTAYSRVATLGPATHECSWTMPLADAVDQEGWWTAEAKVTLPNGPLHSQPAQWYVRAAPAA